MHRLPAFGLAAAAKKPRPPWEVPPAAARPRAQRAPFALVDRREFVSLLALCAVSTGDARSGVSKLASTLPGVGPSDVNYPAEFEGDWQLTSTVAAVDIRSSDGKSSGGSVDTLPAAIADEARWALRLRQDQRARTRRARFVRHRGKVIAQRMFNTRELWAAPSRVGKGNDGSLRVEWDADNPNVLTVSTARGGWKEVRVTKRSFKSNAGGEGTFESSELQRVTVVGAGSSVPEVFAMRTRVRFRRAASSPGDIEALQLDYYYAADSLSAPSPSPLVTVKTYLTLHKEST